MTTHYLAPPERDRFLSLREVYIVVDDGSELRLTNCIFEQDLLIGYTEKGFRVEVELSRIRATYYKKLKPEMPFLAAFSAGAAGIAVWLIVAGAAAPRTNP
jgi:hypothetical protein